MFKDLKILKSHGIQYIKDLRNVNLTSLFRGRPIISENISSELKTKLFEICPSNAISYQPFSLNLAKCMFCRECEFVSEKKIRFTNDYRIAANRYEDLIVYENEDKKIRLNENVIRPEIKRIFRLALKLRQISAGGDNSCEMELNAAGNVNFDMGRFGIQFVASPRHADGIVITGPISENMSEALQLTWEAVPEPKVLILAGTDALSGGLFSESPAINRSFLSYNLPDLLVPGNPCHPLTFINGILDLIGKKQNQ